MTPRPVISVVIPVRDAARFVVATLDSLRAQDEPGFEAIVVEDGSCDDTPALVRAAFARWNDTRFCMIDGPQTGVSAARNAGLARARGGIVVFLDADDLLAPDALARFLRALPPDALHPGGPVAALGQILRMDEGGQPLPSASNLDLLPGRDQLAALLRKNYIVNGGALAMRTAAARAAGGYDPRLRHGEDWEFWCRLLLCGRVVPVPGGPVLRYRQLASGANVRAAGSVFARDVACLRVAAENPDLRARFGRRLPRLLRDRRIDMFWSGVRNGFRHGRKGRTLAIAAAGLVIYPDSVARPGLALRFLRTLGGPS